MKEVTNWIINSLDRRHFPLIKNGLLLKSHISLVYLDTPPRCWDILGKETSLSWTWLTFSSLPSCVSFLSPHVTHAWGETMDPGSRVQFGTGIQQEWLLRNSWHPAVAFLANWAGQEAAWLFFKRTHTPILFQSCDASLKAQLRSLPASAW